MLKWKSQVIPVFQLRLRNQEIIHLQHIYSDKIKEGNESKEHFKQHGFRSAFDCIMTRKKMQDIVFYSSRQRRT